MPRVTYTETCYVTRQGARDDGKTEYLSFEIKPEMGVMEILEASERAVAQADQLVSEIRAAAWDIARIDTYLAREFPPIGVDERGKLASRRMDLRRAAADSGVRCEWILGVASALHDAAMRRLSPETDKQEGK